MVGHVTTTLAYLMLTLQILFGLYFLTEADTGGKVLLAGFAVLSALIWVAALTDQEV